MSSAQRASQTARRKAFTELHPETAHGQFHGNQHRWIANLANPGDRFTADTAAAIGRGERTVQTGCRTRREDFSGSPRPCAGDPARSRQLSRQAQERPSGGSDRECPGGPRRRTTVGRRRRPVCCRLASQVEDVIQPGLFDRFVGLCDQIEGLSTADLIAGSGRQRAVLGQRASCLADRMSEILEGLDR